MNFYVHLQRYPNDMRINHFNLMLMWHLKYNNQIKRCVVYLKKRYPRLEQLQENRGVAPVVATLIPSMATPKIKQYLTIKNSCFSFVTVKKCENIYRNLYHCPSMQLNNL